MYVLKWIEIWMGKGWLDMWRSKYSNNLCAEYIKYTEICRKLFPIISMFDIFYNEIKAGGENDTKHPLANKLKIFRVHLYSCVTKPSQFLKVQNL